MLFPLSQRERGWLVNAFCPVPLLLGEGDYHKVNVFRQTRVRAV